MESPGIAVIAAKSVAETVKLMMRPFVALGTPPVNVYDFVASSASCKIKDVICNVDGCTGSLNVRVRVKVFQFTPKDCKTGGTLSATTDCAA